MNKKKPTTSKLRAYQHWIHTHKLLVIASMTILLVVLPILLRGWVRMTAIPAITKQVKFGQIEDVYSTEIAKLGEPFNALGVKNLTGEEGKCITGYADRFKISVSCVRSQTAYATLEDRSLTAEQIVANAQTLQNTLQAEGWKGIFAESDDATSLSKLVQNIAKGIDYTPDATYIKQVGSISCVFSSHTAFSAPDKPAFETQLWCGQEFYPFGLPEYLRLAQ